MNTLAQILAGLRGVRDRSAAQIDDEALQFVKFCAVNIDRSQAQLFQDAFVAFTLRNRIGGYFVDVGAADGLNLSNTFMLEKQLQWKGILAEPARCWHEALSKNRSAIVDKRCVWRTSGETIDFIETKNPEYSTIGSFRDGDLHKEKRQSGLAYSVESVSLNELLSQHDAPRHIDYISVDTEGSELEILKAFDFKKYAVDIITVEHNFVERNRNEIKTLLVQNGFVRKMKSFSNFDDWYVRQDLLGQ